MRVLWRIRCIPSLRKLPGSLLTGVLTLERVLFIGQINGVQTNDLCYIELLEIEQFDPLTVCEQITDVQLNC